MFGGSAFITPANAHRIMLIFLILATKLTKRQREQKYSQKNVQIKKSARREKRELMDRLAEEEETTARQNDIKIPLQHHSELSGT